jgi:hypothetical protein
MSLESDAPVLPQPLPPPPRQIRRRQGWLLGAVPWWGWLMLGLSLACLATALSRQVSVWSTALLGVIVPGKVLGVTPPAEPGSGARVQLEYHVLGQPYRKEAVIAERFLSQIGPGARVRVRVWSRWPTQAQLLEPPELPSPVTAAWWWAAVLSSASSGILFWRWLRRPLAQRALVRHGMATWGSIVQLEADAGSAEVRWVHVCYQAPRHGLSEAQAAAGTSVPLKEWRVVLPLPPQARACVHPGMAVTVLYDPHLPQRSLIYLFADYEALGSASAAPAASQQEKEYGDV